MSSTKTTTATRIVTGALYRHCRTRALYRVVGVARPAEAPALRVVVYMQIEPSQLRGTNAPLLPGTMWTRVDDSFLRLFAAAHDAGDRSSNRSK